MNFGGQPRAIIWKCPSRLVVGEFLTQAATASQMTCARQFQFDRGLVRGLLAFRCDYFHRGREYTLAVVPGNLEALMYPRDPAHRELYIRLAKASRHPRKLRTAGSMSWR
jgi:hypothetical protein